MIDVCRTWAASRSCRPGTQFVSCALVNLELRIDFISDAKQLCHRHVCTYAARRMRSCHELTASLNNSRRNSKMRTCMSQRRLDMVAATAIANTSPQTRTSSALQMISMLQSPLDGRQILDGRQRLRQCHCQPRIERQHARRAFTQQRLQARRIKRCSLEASAAAGVLIQSTFIADDVACA